MASALALQCSNQQIGLLPMYRSSQLNWLESCSAKAEATGSNPVEVPKLFFGLICNCLNCDYHCSHDQIFIQNLYLESKVQDFLGFPQGPMIPLHGANSTRCKNHKIIVSTLQNRKHVKLAYSRKDFKREKRDTIPA